MGSPPRETHTRRDFLIRTGSAGLALAGGGSLLAACGNTTGAAGSPSAQGGTGDAAGQGAGEKQLLGPGGIPLARVGQTVTLPIYPDNQPIKSGLQPETGGTLSIYNWSDYLYKKVTKEFGNKYGVDVTITTFTNMEEAIAKLSTGEVSFDVFFPVVDYLDKLVAGKVLQPINLSYIPNLKDNVFPSLVDPFYDHGSRYTVPYVIYTMGIGYRRDKLRKSPYQYSNPYDIYWDATYAKGRIGIYDDLRQALGMALLRRGITSVNTEDASLIDRAKDDLVDLADRVNVRVNVTDYTDIPEGKEWIAQAFSGDMITSQYYLPKGTSKSVLGYWYPPKKAGVVGNDTIAIPRTAKNPVLAHMFLNYMLDPHNALENFSWVGYQPPQKSINPDRLVADGLVPETLKSAVVDPSDLGRGYRLLTLTPSGEALWQDAWSQFMAGA